jgi:hypothetical protein
MSPVNFKAATSVTGTSSQHAPATPDESSESDSPPKPISHKAKADAASITATKFTNLSHEIESLRKSIKLAAKGVRNNSQSYEELECRMANLEEGFNEMSERVMMLETQMIDTQKNGPAIAVKSKDNILHVCFTFLY